MATEHQQKRWIKEGRGQGNLKDYKPWITIRDVSSKGRSHRVFGHTTKRTHHLLSDLELAIFLLLDWMMCAEKTGGFNLVNYRHSSGVYHEQETEDLHRRI